MDTQYGKSHAPHTEFMKQDEFPSHWSPSIRVLASGGSVSVPGRGTLAALAGHENLPVSPESPPLASSFPSPRAVATVRIG